MSTRSRFLAGLLALAALAFVLSRVRADALRTAFAEADYRMFFAVMMPNALLYFCWDTFVLGTVVGWFHPRLPLKELLAVRAVSYVFGFVNTNVGRGALLAYLSERLRAPVLEVGSTVLLLVGSEYTHLMAWSTLGFVLAAPRMDPVIAATAAVAFGTWLAIFGWTRERTFGVGKMRGFAPPDWKLFRSFRLASGRQYLLIVLLRAPMFFLSLVAHYIGAKAFGVHIPLARMLAFLPVIYMIATMPISIARLGSTQAAWLFFFGEYAPASRLLAFSLSAHFTFSFTRALLGVAWLPTAYRDLVAARLRSG